MQSCNCLFTLCCLWVISYLIVVIKSKQFCKSCANCLHYSFYLVRSTWSRTMSIIEIEQVIKRSKRLFYFLGVIGIDAVILKFDNRPCWGNTALIEAFLCELLHQRFFTCLIE